MDKEKCFKALSEAHENPEALQLMKQLIEEHFRMIEHMQKTSLYDVYMYEMDIAKKSAEPFRILALQNDDLKKEVNSLRKRLGLMQKYKE